jgi:microcystin-dependent protein
MSDPFLSEIKIMSFGFAPRGWALCNGQLMPINQNQALFSLLGTSYGGDGRNTYALPNLQGRAPMHTGNGLVPGAIGGEAAHTLAITEIPPHTHVAQGSSDNGTTPVPTTTTALGAVSNMYGASANLTTLLPATVGFGGGGQPHQNMQPYLTLSFCIALSGIFPSRN